MRRIVAACALAVLAVPVVALADPPARITIVAVFEPVTYGEDAYVNGQLQGTTDQAGQIVGLEQSPPPFTDWTAVAQATADAAGYYSFKLHPSQTMQYRTSSQGIPSERSVQVSVAPRIALRATAGRTTVRFSGTFAPALDGQRVSIQRRSPSGAWTTIAHARLRGGKTFRGRLRAHKAVMLRALYPADGAHLEAVSNSVRAVPG